MVLIHYFLKENQKRISAIEKGSFASSYMPLGKATNMSSLGEIAVKISQSSIKNAAIATSTTSDLIADVANHTFFPSINGEFQSAIKSTIDTANKMSSSIQNDLNLALTNNFPKLSNNILPTIANDSSITLLHAQIANSFSSITLPITPIQLPSSIATLVNQQREFSRSIAKTMQESGISKLQNSLSSIAKTYSFNEIAKNIPEVSDQFQNTSRLFNTLFHPFIFHDMSPICHDLTNLMPYKIPSELNNLMKAAESFDFKALSKQNRHLYNIYKNNTHSFYDIKHNQIISKRSVNEDPSHKLFMRFISPLLGDKNNIQIYSRLSEQELQQVKKYIEENAPDDYLLLMKSDFTLTESEKNAAKIGISFGWLPPIPSLSHKSPFLMQMIKSKEEGYSLLHKSLLTEENILRILNLFLNLAEALGYNGIDIIDSFFAHPGDILTISGGGTTLYNFLDQKIQMCTQAFCKKTGYCKSGFNSISRELYPRITDKIQLPLLETKSFLIGEIMNVQFQRVNFFEGNNIHASNKHKFIHSNCLIPYIDFLQILLTVYNVVDFINDLEFIIMKFQSSLVS